MNPVQITSTLYEARDAMRFLYKDEYPAQIAEHQKLIQQAMTRLECKALPATTKLVSSLQEKYPTGSEITQALLLAAYVEMVEPSKVNQ